MSYPPIRPAIRPRTTYYDASRRRRREEEEGYDDIEGYDEDDIDCIIKNKIQKIFKIEYGKNNDNSKITLIRFFEEFMEVYDELLAEDYSLLETEYEELSKKLELEKQIYDEIRNKLGDKLVTIQELDLNIDILRNNESPSFFRKKYNSLNKNGKEDILMKEIEKLEKKIKYNPFWKNKNRILLAEKMDELEKIQKASSQADEFESLTPEDKKEIIEYLLSKDRLNNLEKQLSNNKKERSKYRFPKIENERCTRTWSKMLNKGEISDENLDELFKKLDKVGLETERTECGFNIWVQEPDDAYIKHCRTFPDFLEMIQNVYQNARARGRIDSSIKNIAFSQTTSSIKNGTGEIREGVEELETPTRDEDSSISLDD